MQRLWDFAVELYQQDNVDSICLDWQDRFELDVPMLIHACWVGLNGRRIAAEEIAQIDMAVTRWRTVVIKPLRNIRREMKNLDVSAELKTQQDHIRAMVKSIELKAERLAIDFLEEFSLKDLDINSNGRNTLENMLVVFTYFSHMTASGADFEAVSRLEEASQLAYRRISL